MIRTLIFSALAVTSLAMAAPASATDYGAEVLPVGSYGQGGYNQQYSQGGYNQRYNQGGYRQQYNQSGYERECFEKPIRQWRYGRWVTVGFRTVCN